MNEDALIRVIKVRVQNPRLRSDLRANPPPLFLPAGAATIARAEAALGLTLPPFLSRLYREVANGGFGPGGGLVGLQGGHGDSAGLTLVEVYTLFRKVDEGWPGSLLPLWEGAPPVWFGIDARSAEGRILLGDEYGARATAFTLCTWLEAWLNGVNLFERMGEFEGASVANPFTGDPGKARPQGRLMGTPAALVGRETK
jgi:hypothetical protein